VIKQKKRSKQQEILLWMEFMQGRQMNLKNLTPHTRQTDPEERR
jgi:hypothetical protein